jgi:hypothetical protein
MGYVIILGDAVTVGTLGGARVMEWQTSGA